MVLNMPTKLWKYIESREGEERQREDATRAYRKGAKGKPIREQAGLIGVHTYGEQSQSDLE